MRLSVQFWAALPHIHFWTFIVALFTYICLVKMITTWHSLIELIYIEIHCRIYHKVCRWKPRTVLSQINILKFGLNWIEKEYQANSSCSMVCRRVKAGGTTNYEYTHVANRWTVGWEKRDINLSSWVVRTLAHSGEINSKR